MLNFIQNISPIEVVAIALILIVLFGSKTVTNLGRLAGQTLKEIKNIGKNVDEALEDDDKSKKNKKEVS